MNKIKIAMDQIEDVLDYKKLSRETIKKLEYIYDVLENGMDGVKDKGKFLKDAFRVVTMARSEKRNRASVPKFSR